jgi:hypothetical protein
MSGGTPRGNFITMTYEEAKAFVERAADAVEKRLHDGQQGEPRTKIIRDTIAGEMLGHIRD